MAIIMRKLVRGGQYFHWAVLRLHAEQPAGNKVVD